MNLSKDEKKVLSYWGLACLIIVISLFAYSFIKKESVNKINKEAMSMLTSNDSNYLSDENVYYTAKSAINKFYSFYNMKDYKSVLSIINEDYKNKKNLNESNLQSLNVNISSFDSYHPMCVKSINKSILNLVVFGEEVSNKTSDKIKDVYYEISLNYNTYVFNIKPIDKKEYEGVCNA